MVEASVVEAAIVGTVTKVKDPAIGLPFAAPEAALGAPWVSYLVGLKSTAGEILGAADFEITGQFHQRWEFSDDDGDFYPTPRSSDVATGDSHLLIAPGVIIGAGPLEDSSSVGSPLLDVPGLRDYGVGTKLRGAWELKHPWTTIADLAYIVVRSDSEPFTDITVDVYDQDGIIDTLTKSDFTSWIVPEPSAAVLFVLATTTWASFARRRGKGGTFCFREK
jgi:hypothetical protein